MSYWDTACLVKLYVSEPNSAEFEAYAATLDERPVTGEFARLELWTVLRRKEAESSLASGEARQLLDVFEENAARGLTQLVPLTEKVSREFERVVEKCLSQKPPVFIRTLDALHLAAAREADETCIVTTDKRLRDGALLLGFTVFPANAGGEVFKIS